MPGYVAVALLEASAIRVDRAGRPAPDAEGAWLPSPTVEDVRVVRSLASEQLRERLGQARRVWAQTTFYLFDPESWR